MFHTSRDSGSLSYHYFTIYMQFLYILSVVSPDFWTINCHPCSMGRIPDSVGISNRGMLICIGDGISGFLTSPAAFQGLKKMGVPFHLCQVRIDMNPLNAPWNQNWGKFKAHVWPIALVGSRNEATIHNLQQVIRLETEMRWYAMLRYSKKKHYMMRCGFKRRMLLDWDVILHSLQNYRNDTGLWMFL